MNTQNFIDAETAGNRAVRAAKVFADAADKADLNRVDYILAEVRFFAMGWHDVRESEDSKAISAEDARAARQDLITRLTTACAPGRL